MKIVRTVHELEALRPSWRQDAGFVPTMGGLHDGHIALVEAARAHHNVVVVSVYVNPLQFGLHEDFNTYPRTEESDAARLAAAGVDVLFMPGDDEIYPRGRNQQTQVYVPGLSDDLCGHFRPGHFQGVATVVARLLGLVRPSTCYLGKKDYQQWRLIELMVADLHLGATVTGVPTLREADGLALSTRNRYLSDPYRALAPTLYQTLRDAVARATAGEALASVERASMVRLEGHGFVPDYVAVRRAADLASPSAEDRDLVILAAARLGATRLIDNQEFQRPLVPDQGCLHDALKTG